MSATGRRARHLVGIPGPGPVSAGQAARCACPARLVLLTPPGLVMGIGEAVEASMTGALPAGVELALRVDCSCPGSSGPADRSGDRRA